MGEKWLPSKSLPKYEASTKGRVRNAKTGRVLKQRHNRNGYPVVSVRGEDNKTHTKLVSNIVAETFIEDKRNNRRVCYIDRDKNNTRPENLEYRTLNDILKRDYKAGRVKPHNNKKIQVVETGETYNSISECSKATGVNRATISKCLNYGFYKNRSGYHFKEVD